MSDFWRIPTGWRLWPGLVGGLPAVMNARGEVVVVTDALRNAAHDLPTRERAADYAPWRPDEPVAYSHWGLWER